MLVHKNKDYGQQILGECFTDDILPWEKETHIDILVERLFALLHLRKIYLQCRQEILVSGNAKRDLPKLNAALEKAGRNDFTTAFIDNLLSGGFPEFCKEQILPGQTGASPKGQASRPML